MSRFHFHRIFTKSVGMTPKAYANACRAERVRRELPKRESVAEAVCESGYNSSGRFYAESERMLGMMPKTAGKKGLGELIQFAVRSCSLGFILVAASSKGVCAVLMGDVPEALTSDLRIRFSKARFVAGDEEFQKVVAEVIRFVEAPKIGLHLPLDVRGTVFQSRVWQALQRIPVGSTWTYAEVAKHIGSPKAVRAVAGACAANALAVAIPCHRVVRTDGSLSGYRWGVERKRELLNREGHKPKA